MITSNPAKILGLDVGSINEKSEADLIVFDPNNPESKTRKFFSKSKNSPFDGMILEGKNIMTFVKKTCL